MKIGVLGAGNIGGGLGKIWAHKDHEVFFGSRSSEKGASFAHEVGGNSQGGTNLEAASFGDVLILAVPWFAAEETISALGDLNGKILVDCTNPLKEGLAGLSVGPDISQAEKVAEWAKGAKVVKGFNTLGSDNLTNLQFGTQIASNFICGDDQEAKATVSKLAEDIGFDVVDCGPLSQARLLEPLALLWITLAYKYGMGTEIAFKLLRR
jgi:NADPH-dependent F420 reductase